MVPPRTPAFRGRHMGPATAGRRVTSRVRKRLSAGGNAIRTIGPSATVISSWRALPSVAIPSEATRIFPAHIIFNLPTFSSNPTPDPSSA